MDVFNAFKGIADMIRDAVEGAMPRQAVVTRSEESGVWVRYTPVNADSPEMWFPSSIAGLPAGTSGWVHPLAGGKGRFIATAVPQVHSIEPYRNGSDPLGTTSIDSNSPYWWSGDDTSIVRQVTLTPGVWEFDIVVSMKNRRDVTTGGVWITYSVDGQQANVLDYRTTPRDQYIFTTDTRRFTVNVDTERVVPIRLGFCGWSTSGTTYGYQPLLTGTYKLIGGS